MSAVCYLDLDGVLVDFVGGALKAHGKTLPPADVGWGFAASIGFSGLDDPAFWAPMGHDFWDGLGWTAEGRVVLDQVENLFGDRVVLMTSPCDTPGAVGGKVSWIRRELPAYRRRFFVGPAKHLAAGPTKVLVDDHDGNADKFVEGGGLVVMPPRPWNRRRGESDPSGGFCLKAFGAELYAAWAAACHNGRGG